MKIRMERSVADAGKKLRIRWSLLLALVVLYSGAAVAQSPSGVYVGSKVLRSMAKMYTAYGNYEKARPLAERALAWARMNGASDYELAACMIDLAFVYEKEGSLGDAEKMCISALKLEEKIYYENHPYIAQTLRILSCIYKESGKYDQSLAAMERAMKIMRQSQLPDDKAMAPFYVDFARLLATMGRLAESQEYYHKAQELLKSSYAVDHLYMANVQASVARLHSLQGKYVQAETELNHALVVQQQVYGSNNQLLASTWLTLAMVCQQKRNYSRAEKLLTRTLEAVDNDSKTESLFLGPALSGLGQLYISRGNYAKADDVCHRAVSVLEKSRGPDDVHTAMALNNLAKLYIHQKKYSQAQELCDKALDSLERVYDRENPNVSEVRRTIARLNRRSAMVANAVVSQLNMDSINELIALARPN